MAVNYGCVPKYPAPADCASIVLPPVNFATCAAAYNAHESEITDIYVIETTDGVADSLPVNWWDTSDWDTTFAAAKHLVVIGDKPLSETNEITVARKWTKSTSRTHTVNADITDMTIENYDFVRSLQVQPTVAIWYRTMDGYVFGGPNGIVCDARQAGNVLGRGEGTLLTGQMVYDWECDNDPDIALDGTDPNA